MYRLDPGDDYSDDPTRKIVELDEDESFESIPPEPLSGLRLDCHRLLPPVSLPR